MLVYSVERAKYDEIVEKYPIFSQINQNLSIETKRWRNVMARSRFHRISKAAVLDLKNLTATTCLNAPFHAPDKHHR